MKKVYKDKIVNIDKNLFDNKFLFDVFENISVSKKGVEIFFMRELLEKKKNVEILEKTKEKPGMWSNVYSPKDEFEIFLELYNYALENNKKIHIIGITLREEVEILEKYYEELGFLREDINCFLVDFSVPLITVSVNIENIMWKGSDYKSQKEKIFFVPPIRESGQVKAMFKGINRGSIAGIYVESYDPESNYTIYGGKTTGIYVENYDKNIINFLKNQIKEEHILPLILAKNLKYNYEEIGIFGVEKKLEIYY